MNFPVSERKGKLTFGIGGDPITGSGDGMVVEIEVVERSRTDGRQTNDSLVVNIGRRRSHGNGGIR